ncbi:MAG: gliding motility protein RemB [Mucilaginibacter sp.]|uniref:gliding motility protein RemB n=1 Tax=Mucilaginibacter sp. TaxID=1882438 RepID=UPI0032678CE5
MKYIYPVEKKRIFYLSLLLLLFTSGSGFAQLVYQPYSYQFYQKLNKTVYSPATTLHTALKPYFISDSSAIRHPFDSLMQNNIDNSNKSWLNHVLFSGHVVEVKNKEYTFYMDYLSDFGFGREFNDSRSTNINTRGYQIGGTIGTKFFFYTSGYENQGKFANYIEDYITRTGMVPSQSYDRTSNGNSQLKNTRDWSYVTAMIGFAPTNKISIALGQDKTFIGDGYRSVLLSDYASTYPLLRFSIDLGKHVQYMAQWAYMDNQLAPRFDVNPSGSNYRRTWAVFHYIDWNINNRASIGFFNALIAAEADDQGNRHGFDVNYINPVFFSRSLGPGGIPDHTLFGFNGKYKVLDKTTVYGQAMFDQSASSNTGPRNAFQLGFRGSDLFKVNSLNYLVEFNTASPYTYSNQYPIVNYAQLNEPLAHPFGANFKEVLGIVNYSIGKFDLQGQLNYAKYGLNTTTVNYGKDITLADNTLLPTSNTGTGQGISTTLKYAEGTVAYMLNPKYNLRVEVGAVLRQETNALTDTKTAWLTLGLKTTFRNLYHDF